MRKSGPSFIILPVIPMIALWSSIAFGGVQMSFENKALKGEAGMVSRFFIEGKKLRIENSKGGVMLFDGDQQKLWTIDPKQKSYAEITEADLAKVQGMKGQMEQQMKEQMSKLPPDQKKKMEEMMAKHGAGDAKERRLTFEAAGKPTKTDHGFSCNPYRVLDEGKPIEEACFIPWKEAGVSMQDFQAFEAFGQFLKKMGGDSNHQGQIFNEMREAPGIPARTAIIRQDGATGGEQELTELKRQSIPADQFTLPAGFKKQPMLEGGEVK